MGCLELSAINSVPFYLYKVISSGLEPAFVYLKTQIKLDSSHQFFSALLLIHIFVETLISGR